MIATGLKLDTAVEVHRISTRGYLRASIRLVADDADAGVVEIRRAYGQGGPVLPYATAKTVALNGETIVDIIADDCPELAIVVTTPGAGTFDVEITLDLPCEDAFAAIELDELHTAASWPLSIVPERDRKSTRLNSSHITRSRMPSSA